MRLTCPSIKISKYFWITRMEFKYQTDYDELSIACPPTDHTARNIEPVYRWVFSSIEEEGNFTPQFFKNPKRFLNESDSTKCKSLGLSLFVNLDDSIERFNELKEYIGIKIYSALGTRIAEGKLNDTDGVNGEIERLGHFTHHSATPADYAKNFVLLEKKL